MWLLSTDRAELHFFATPESATGGYAILSHTWGHGNEQSFQEIQALRERCAASGENPRDLASPKIRECCILAENHGYRWLWVDSCCIDKTSSTELSEAINSMFRWYSLAEVCFAYLEDVESDCDLHAAGSSFRTAKWHSRGWTLQELIAPMLVIFVSQDWHILGNKVELAPLLQQITGIWRQVLTREVHYSVISVAQRMSWAANRNTTRVEDEAYCLVGLFNVNMPTIYGEGRQAFLRLQHEIMKQSIDTSLFAWGPGIDSESVTPMEPQEFYQYFNTTSQNHVYLFADSPRNFVKPFGLVVRFTPSATYPLQPYLDWQRKTSTGDLKLDPKASTGKESGPFGRMKLPRFSITSYGVECHFPIIESGGLTVAVLLCDDNREHIGLLLHPSNVRLQDPSRKKYHVGLGFRTPSGGVAFARLISLGNDFYNLRVLGKTVTAEWRDIFIADSPPPIMKDVAPNLCHPLHCITPAPPFRIPHWLIGRLTQLGMHLRPLQVQSRPVDRKPLELSATFENVCAREGIRVILGTCAHSETQAPLAAHWAKAMPQSLTNWGQKTDFGHDCGEHHVVKWPGWTKDFGDAERTVRLSFSQCRLTPKYTFVVHVELEGQKYSAMKGEKNVEFPTREGSGLRISVVESGEPSVAPAGPTVADTDGSP